VNSPQKSHHCSLGIEIFAEFHHIDAKGTESLQRSDNSEARFGTKSSPTPFT
jgi:hypothetical protein